MRTSAGKPDFSDINFKFAAALDRKKTPSTVQITDFTCAHLLLNNHLIKVPWEQQHVIIDWYRKNICLTFFANFVVFFRIRYWGWGKGRKKRKKDSCWCKQIPYTDPTTYFELPSNKSSYSLHFRLMTFLAQILGQTKLEGTSSLKAETTRTRKTFSWASST